MLKVSNDLLVRAELIEGKGVTRDLLFTLYKVEGVSMRRIVPEIQKYESSATLKDVNALLSYFNIPRMSVSEQKLAAKSRPVKLSNLESKINSIAELGFTKSKVQELYSQDLSKNEIISLINKEAKSNLIHKTWLKKMFALWEIKEKTPEEVNALRMAKINSTLAVKRESEKPYGRGYSAAQIIEFYDNGLSLTSIYREYGVSPQTSSKIIKASGREVKRDIPAVETIQQLEEKGVTKEVIEKMYLEENCSFKYLQEFLSRSIDRKLGDKAVSTTLSKLGIKKTREQLRDRRGAKSRDELAANMSKLHRAGFDNLLDLAKYYESNYSLTKAALIKQMNSTVTDTEEPFTVRWLDRHMDPHLSTDRLRGTSRVEKEFIEVLKDVVDSSILTGKYSVIPPYQLDAYFPDLSLAIEFNGDYWHSDKFLLHNHGVTSLEYHSMKLQRCKEIGVDLLFVWESDWYRDPEVVIEAIKNFVEERSVAPEILAKLTVELPNFEKIAA